MTGTLKEGLGVIIGIFILFPVKATPRPYQIVRLFGQNSSLIQLFFGCGNHEKVDLELKKNAGMPPEQKGVPFEFDRVEEHPKFDQEKKIQFMLDRLYRQCQNVQQRNAPKQMVIDAARELVEADDEYKAQADSISAFFFAHPQARDIVIFSTGAVTGAVGFWLSS